MLPSHHALSRLMRRATLETVFQTTFIVILGLGFDLYYYDLNHTTNHSVSFHSTIAYCGGFTPPLSFHWITKW